jgi:hypothetical protein
MAASPRLDIAAAQHSRPAREYGYSTAYPSSRGLPMESRINLGSIFCAICAIAFGVYCLFASMVHN